MARLERVSPIAIPQHIIQRGNNRQTCFLSADDLNAYLRWLTEYSNKYDVNIHAWVLMPNHVHLLCTPHTEMGVSKMMQSLGRMYVRYFNCTYNRTGTLWEGRFKSCLIQADDYLLALSRYIEMNPVRSGIVDNPAQYTWSSYQCNGLGKELNGLVFHAEYLKLGDSPYIRQMIYRKSMTDGVSDRLLERIRESTNKGLALGDQCFTTEIEKLTSQRVTAGKKGRPQKKKTLQHNIHSIFTTAREENAR